MDNDSDLKNPKVLEFPGENTNRVDVDNIPFTVPPGINKQDVDFFKYEIKFTAKKFKEIYFIDPGRTIDLLIKYVNFVFATKKSLYKEIVWDDVNTLQNSFSKVYENANFVFTLYDGMKKGLVSRIIYDPIGQRSANEIIVGQEHTEPPGFLDNFAKMFAGVFSKPILELLKSLLPAIVVAVVFFFIWQSKK